LKAYPGETTEAFCDAHVATFVFFGGVPVSILHRNTRITFANILGGTALCEPLGKPKPNKLAQF
jgi:hypothetical protein